MNAKRVDGKGLNAGDVNFAKGNGLVPAIVQDARTLQVLMLGYMNAESLAETEATGRVTFWSRSRGELWTKGATSGNVLELVSVEADCDADTLLVKAIPAGPTCHLGSVSCFGTAGARGAGFLAALEAVIAGREGGDPDESYTARLLAKPVHKVAQKVGEEGVETALAATSEDDAALAGEAADLIYHLLVLLRKRGLELEDVVEVLRERHGV